MSRRPVSFEGSWRKPAWLILGIGGLIVLGGVALGWGSLRHVLYSERADGEVIEILRQGNMYAPVVRFRLPNGSAQEVTDLGTGAPDFAVGDRVTILYAPQDPTDFRIATFERLWLSALIVTVFGCFWLLFGLIAWALSRNADLAIVGERAFAAIALAAAAIGAVVFSAALDLYGSGTRTMGTIAEVRESRTMVREDVRLPDGREVSRDVERTSYAPIVRFDASDGREIEFHGRGGSGTDYAEGDRVTVIYDPANPMRAHIVSFIDLWLPSAVCFGVVALFGGAAWLSRRLRLRVPPPSYGGGGP
jgi:hypothetical protein